MTSTARPWRIPVISRDPDEPHRASTPLELLFDLCFVVAVSSAALGLEHSLGEGHVGSGLLHYVMVFFAIWWAWMNFTWFASAYDTDDVPYRLLTLVQLAGILVLAAGVPDAFEHEDFRAVTIGYTIIRVAMIAHWLRAARDDPQYRTNTRRYAFGLAVVQIGWLLRLALPDALGILGFFVLVVAEVAVPVWAERPGMTTWHPGHIAERYGLFTLIVLGECVLTSTNTLQQAITSGGFSTPLVAIAAGGLLLFFGLWWCYFRRPAEFGLRMAQHYSFLWGYAHYAIFAALAATGAGIQVVAQAVAHQNHLGPAPAAFTVAVPVALTLLAVGLLQSILDPSGSFVARFVAAAVAVLAAAAAGWLGLPAAAAILVMALVVCALVALDLLDR
jgi:low temperature requirement protein LtrA